MREMPKSRGTSKISFPRLASEGRRKSGLTPTDYCVVYEPDRVTNTCCEKCSKAFNGCSWARELKPVEGWVATPFEYRTNATDPSKEISYKIFYCPEFDDQSPVEYMDDNRQGFEKLMTAYFYQAQIDYRRLLKEIIKQKEYLDKWTIPPIRATRDYQDLLVREQMFHDVFPAHILRLIRNEEGYKP